MRTAVNPESDMEFFKVSIMAMLLYVNKFTVV